MVEEDSGRPGAREGERAGHIKVKTKTVQEEGDQHAKLCFAERDAPSSSACSLACSAFQAVVVAPGRAPSRIGSISVALRNTAFVHEKCENTGNIG